MVFKYVNNLVPEYPANTFVPRSRIQSEVTRSRNLLHTPQCRLSSGQRAFTYCERELWSNTSNDFQRAKNMRVLRHRLVNAFRVKQLRMHELI